MIERKPETWSEIVDGSAPWEASGISEEEWMQAIANAERKIPDISENPNPDGSQFDPDGSNYF